MNLRPDNSGRDGRDAPVGPLPGAVLFDMDGLLVDSEPVWTIAEQEVAAELGGVFTAEIKAAMLGRGVVTAVPIMLAMLGGAAATADPVAVGARMVARTIELFREPDRLSFMPGAVELLERLVGAGVPTALVSSSYRPLMATVLDLVETRLGPGRFPVTVAGDEVARAKPAPDAFLEALARLGRDPAECVVLEDSEAGARAGLAAGCATVLVPSTHYAEGRSPYPLPAALREVTVVPSLVGVTPTLLATLTTDRAPGAVPPGEVAPTVLASDVAR
ncbi:MAG: HAD family hydrolase [Frankia sp.]